MRLINFTEIRVTTYHLLFQTQIRYILLNVAISLQTEKLLIILTFPCRILIRHIDKHEIVVLCGLCAYFLI